MNWTFIIKRNHERLLQVVAELFAVAGLDDTGLRETLPRATHAWLLRILRPAESAARRLVIIAASRLGAIVAPQGAFMRGLDRKAASRHVAGKDRQGKAGEGEGASRIPPFALTDPLKTFSFEAPPSNARGFPRITFIGVSDPSPLPVARLLLPGDPVPAAALCRRLAALRRALDDLDGQAQRLLRWQARRDRALANARRGLPRSPLRVGRPPGSRMRPYHEIDSILRDLDSFAACAMIPPDSS